ncbi:MAG: L,D-transpeptidase family protein [Proteobacteria bacterium]|nr:L,D-transpeptidase family protein [Pseudomonadota bacterium]
MSLHSVPTRGLAATLLAGALALQGCSLLRSSDKDRAKPVPPPPPPPALPAPQATHKFVLEGDGDEVVGYVQKTKVGKDDTLPDIARRFDIGYEEMLLANPGVDPWLPGVGREVVVPTRFVLPAAPHEGLVVNVAAMRVFYFPPHKKGEKQTVITHPIGIGRVGWKTPEGTTKIVSRQKDPVWVVPKSVRQEHAQDGDILPAKVPAGPDNPLGQYMFRLGWPSYLVHGTNKPYGVGMRSSHGCIRLYPEDIAVLFEIVPIGTKVTVVNQPYVFGWHEGKLYLQAYAVMEDDKRDWSKNRKRLLDRLLAPKLRKRIADHDQEIDWDEVGQFAHAPRGVPVPVTGERGGVDAVLAEAREVENELPLGSNWDGKSGLLVDEKTFNELLGGRNKPDPAPVAAAEAPAPTVH